MFIIFILLLAANLGVSIWNAYATGKAWAEAKAAGGRPRALAWAGATMSACGMTWCILVILLLIAVNTGVVGLYWADVAIASGFILILPAAIISGFLIAADNWARAYRTRAVSDFAMASYNTFADVYNTYHFIRGVGPALGKIFSAFFGGGGSGKKGGALIVILLVIVALSLGIIITAVIITHVAANEKIPTWQEAVRNRLHPHPPADPPPQPTV